MTFDDSVKISEAAVYWFDDTGIGEFRPPNQWWIEWDSEGERQSVQNASEYGLRLDIFNHVTFNSATTHRVRIVAQLQDNMSSGLLEWRLILSLSWSLAARRLPVRQFTTRNAPAPTVC